MVKAYRNLHVPVPGKLYDLLREASDMTHRPATELAREAIQEWIKARERETLKAEIRAYASKVAGTREDLDPDLEEAAIEHLAMPRKRRRS